MANRDLIRVSGDHHIQAKNDIILETQYENGNAGTVHVYGNLFVSGATTELASSNISIADRILILNKGEPGTNGQPGITQQISGIRIQRFSDPALTGDPTLDDLIIAQTSADWVFNEGRTWTYNGTINTGLWQGNLGTSIWGIATNAIRTATVSTNLSLLGVENSNAVLTVEGTTDYEDQVTHHDHIPNKRWTDLAIFAQPDRRNLQLNFYTDPTDPDSVVLDPTTKIEITGPAVPNSGVAEKQIKFFVDSSQYLTVFSNRVNLGQMQFKNTNEITMNSPGTKLVLSTLPTVGSTVNPDIEIKSSLSMVIDLTHDASLNETGKIKLYPAAEGPGGTGLYFVNSENVRDELPSKRRSFFASLMF